MLNNLNENKKHTVRLKNIDFNEIDVKKEHQDLENTDTNFISLKDFDDCLENVLEVLS